MIRRRPAPRSAASSSTACLPLQARCRHSGRPGVSLLEMVLATGIAVIFLYAVYLTTAMQYAQLESGRVLAEEAQVVRGLARVLRADLRDTFSQTSSTSSSSSSSAPASDGDTTSELLALMAEDSATDSGTGEPPASGIVGTADQLEVVTWITPPVLEEDRSPLVNLMPTADTRRLSYYLATASNPGPNGETGLLRVETYDLPNASDYDAPLNDVRVLVADAVGLAFAYHDGTDWTDSWSDSSVPRAVEVLVQLPFAQRQDPLATNVTTDAPDQPVRTLRVVVAIAEAVAVPEAEPPVPAPEEEEAEAGTGAPGAASGS